MTKRVDRFNKKAFTFARVHYKKISYDKFKKAEFAMSNSACHFNAVAAVNGGRADKVWLVYSGSESGGAIHFINSKRGVYFDETWHDYKNQNYYIIREVLPFEFEDIFDLLVATKQTFYDMFCLLPIRKSSFHSWL